MEPALGEPSGNLRINNLSGFHFGVDRGDRELSLSRCAAEWLRDPSLAGCELSGPQLLCDCAFPGTLLDRSRPAPLSAGFANAFDTGLASFLPEEARRTPVEPALERAFPELLRPRDVDLGFASFFGLPTPVGPELEPSETSIASLQLSLALGALLINFRTSPSSRDPGVENDFCVSGDVESPAIAAITPADTVESDMAR